MPRAAALVRGDVRDGDMGAAMLRLTGCGHANGAHWE